MGCINKHRCNTCPKPCQVEIQHHRLDEWFTSVSVVNREKITGINYPDCTDYWNNLSRQEKVDMIDSTEHYRVKGTDVCALGHDF